MVTQLIIELLENQVHYHLNIHSYTFIVNTTTDMKWIPWKKKTPLNYHFVTQLNHLTCLQWHFPNAQMHFQNTLLNTVLMTPL